MAKTAAKKPAAKSTATKAAPVKKAEPKKAVAPKAAKTEKVKAEKVAPVVEPKAAKPVKEPKVAKPKLDPAEKAALKAKKSEETKARAEKLALSEEEKKWSELYEKHKTEKTQSYDMKATFEAGKPLQHKILGWGWIISNDNDRLEVLFKDGKRILISNYNR